jgi:hypothetical protein
VEAPVVFIGSMGATLFAIAALLAPAAQAQIGRWLVIGALALLAVYLLVGAVRCALRVVGLVVLAAVAFLAWRWIA